MKVAVLGCGAVGSLTVKRLASTGRFAEVVAVDVNPQLIEELGRVEGVSAVKLDVSDEEALRRLLKDVDLACEALPGRLGFKAMETAVIAGVNVVSVSYTPEDPFKLEEEAVRRGVLIVPDCGLAPGLSNVLAGRASSLMDELLELHIKAGGLPSTPTPPLRHVSSWSIDDLLEEYTRRARMVKGGKVVEIDPLSSYEVLAIPGLGVFECFCTDGLRTLLRTLKARDMDEKTIRQRGHIATVKALVECGLLMDEPLRIDGVEVEPRRVLKALLARAWRGFEEDLLILLVEALGLTKQGKAKLCFSLVGQGAKPSPLLKATASTFFHFTSMVAEGLLKGEGIYPPERLGMDPNLYEEFSTRLRRDGLMVEESWATAA